jgi:glycosyltransferase involved in cell wall biosynthesis
MQRINNGKINVAFVGHVDKNTGYGRAARDWCRALRDYGDVNLGVDTFEETNEDWRGAHGFDFADDYPDVVVIHERIPWAPGAPETGQDLVDDFLDPRGWTGRPVVLATAWEVCGLSGALSDYLARYDAVVVPSEQSRNWLCRSMYLGMRHNARIRVVPHAVDVNYWTRRSRDRKHVTDRKRFLYVGQWNDRKNPAGVLKAYLAAFDSSDRERVKLHLHCPGMTEQQLTEAKGILASSGLRPEELPPLEISTEHVSDEILRSAYWEADVFVTAARGEGFNLPAVEAAATGCQILANEAAVPAFEFPDYDDTVDGVRTVEGTMVPVFPGGTVRAVGGGVQFESTFPRGVTCKQQWSEPDLSYLASEMREMVTGDNPRVVPRELLQQFSYQSVGKQFGDFLREVVDKKGSKR